MRPFPAVALALLLSPYSIAEDASEPGLPREQRPVLEARRLERPPTLAEFLDPERPPEIASRMAVVDGGFVQRLPHDGRPATFRTVVYLGYDDEALHVVFVASDDEPGAIRATMGRRETFTNDDIVQILVDTFLDERRAYSFICNPFGVQFDAVWTEGSGFDFSFDTVWESEGTLTDRGYVVRMAIPFKSLRFPRAPEQRWGLLFNRDVPRLNEETFWPRYSNRIQGRLNQTGTLNGLAGISPGRNLQFIPYATARRYRVLGADASTFEEDSFDADAGVDAKWVIRDRLVLDLTANPDFSQVESDQPQITTNQRFEVFFPEKRPFFLENASYFETPVTLLFTRRIGDPLGGVRATGKLGGWAVGALVMDDEAPGKVVAATDPAAGERARFLIGRVARDILGQSTVGVMATDRTFAGSRNTVGSLDSRITWNRNWASDLQVAGSRTRSSGGETLEDEAFFASLERQGRHLGFLLRWQDIGRDFRADAGFVPRTDIRDGVAAIGYTFRPEGGRLLSWEPEVVLRRIDDHAGVRLDEEAKASLQFEFPRQTRVWLAAEAATETLRPVDAPALPAPVAYDADAVEVAFESSPVRSVTFGASAAAGDGIHLTPAAGSPPEAAHFVSGELGLQWLPARRLRLKCDGLYTRLDPPGGPGRFFADRIVRLRTDLQLTRRWSLRAIVQHERLVADPGRSALAPLDRWDGDFLLAWQKDPWTALYAGWNSRRQNVTPGGEAIETGEQVFVKVSWLFRL